MPGEVPGPGLGKTGMQDMLRTSFYARCLQTLLKPFLKDSLQH